MDEQFYASIQTVLNDMDSRVASSSSTSTARGRHMQILSRFTSGSQQQHRHQPHHHQASNSSAVLEGTTAIYDTNDQQSSTNDTISFNLCTKVGTLQIPCVFKTRICHSAFADKRRFAHTHQIQHKCIHSVNFKNSTTTTYYILF